MSSEIYYDKRSVQLLVGDDALEAHLEASQGFAEVVDLVDIFDDEDFEASKPDLHCSRAELPRTECLVYGAWVLGLAQKLDMDKPSHAMYQRLFEVGAGPSPGRIKRPFKFLWRLHEELGVPPIHAVHRFDDWGVVQYVEHAKRVEHDLGRKPGERDYDRYFREGEGPSRVMMRGIGGVRRLNELIGYPDIQSWEEDDYIEWGVKLMEANPGKKMTVDMIHEMSRRRRGPSLNPIIKYFDKFSAYKRKVQEAYAQKTIADVEVTEELFELHESLAQKSYIPQDIFAGEDNAKDKRTVNIRCAKYRLFAPELPDEPPSVYRHLASLQMPALQQALQKRAPHVTPAFLETKALELGVFDELWPMDDHLKYLKFDGLKTTKKLGG